MENVRFEAYDNRYVDASSDRYALQLNARHFFRFTRKLTPDDWTALWAFYQAHLTAPFYYYHGPETTPQIGRAHV